MESAKFLKTTIVVLLLVNIATLVFMWTSRHSEGSMQPAPGGPSRVAEYLTHELNLTVDQQKKFEELRDVNHEKIQELNQKSGKMHKEYFDMLGSPQLDSGKMMQLADSMSACTKKIELLTFEHFREVRALCNAEQQKKFDVIIQDALRMMSPKRPRPER
jgi:Spy/CpxP family protein refolding chaperone